MYKILGFSRFTSKSGKPCCTIQLAKEFSEREKQEGSCGLKIVKRRDGSDIFLPDSCMNIVSADNVGKECDVLFSETGFIFDIRLIK